MDRLVHSEKFRKNWSRPVRAIRVIRGGLELSSIARGRPRRILLFPTSWGGPLFPVGLACSMEGNTGRNVIGSHHKVHYIEFACILSYRTRYAVMTYTVMLYCNRNTVLRYSLTLYRNQNSTVSYSNADVACPVAFDRNLYAVVSYSVTWYRN